jgi:hypothetical protein
MQCALGARRQRMCSGTMTGNSSRSRHCSSSFQRRDLKARASSIKTMRLNCPRRLRYGVHNIRQGHCCMATRHTAVKVFWRQISRKQSIPTMQSLDHVREPAKPSIIPRVCVVQGDLQRSLARHSAPERCCTKAIQTSTHPERASGLRNCILRVVPRCISQSPNPANVRHCHHELTRAASFAAGCARRFAAPSQSRRGSA